MQSNSGSCSAQRIFRYFLFVSLIVRRGLFLWAILTAQISADDGYKLTVTLVEGEHIPTAVNKSICTLSTSCLLFLLKLTMNFHQASLWQEGKEFHAGFELQAHFCLVSCPGGSPKEEPVAIFKAKHSETPKWQQKVGLNINSGTHVDLVLRIQMMFSDGTHQPWGLLRLPLSEIIARGSHQGWFYLSDLMGDPFRKILFCPAVSIRARIDL